MFLADWLKNMNNVTSMLMRVLIQNYQNVLMYVFVDYFKVKKCVFYNAFEITTNRLTNPAILLSFVGFERFFCVEVTNVGVEGI